MKKEKNIHKRYFYAAVSVLRYLIEMHNNVLWSVSRLKTYSSTGFLQNTVNPQNIKKCSIKNPSLKTYQFSL